MTDEEAGFPAGTFEKVKKLDPRARMDYDEITFTFRGVNYIMFQDVENDGCYTCAVNRARPSSIIEHLANS